MIVPVAPASKPSVCRQNPDVKATTGIEPVHHSPRPSRTTPAGMLREYTTLLRENLAQAGGDQIMLTWKQVTLRVTASEARLLTPQGQFLLPLEGDVSPEFAAWLERVEVDGG